jgi:CHAD domain-containing protein
MAVRTVTEIERKYDVDAEVPVPDLSTIAPVRAEETVVMRAVYFDTPQNDLASKLTVLRRRSGGTDEGWHVKKPADTGRTEFHVPLDSTSSEQTPPVEILEVVRDLLGNGPLQEIARLTTERATLTLLGDAGTALAEVTDDLVSATDVRTGILRVWREWEVELAEDGPTDSAEQNALLDAIEAVLLAAGARTSRSASKLARSLGRHSLAPEDATSAAGTDTTAAAPGTDTDAAAPATALGAANIILTDLTARLLAAEPEVRADEDDAVHAMRILTRRVRGVLAAFRGVWEPDAADPLRDQFRQLGDVLGTVRDAEVRRSRALRVLGDAGDAPDAHRRLVDDTLGEYEALHTDLVRFLDSSDYAELLRALDALTAAPATSDLATVEPLPALRAALRRQQDRALRRLKGVDRSDLDALHSARKAARRLRYVAEALTEGDTPVLGAKARGVAVAAEQVQDVLGTHRDATLFVQRLAETSTQAAEAGENVDIYAELEKSEGARATEASDAITRAKKDLKKAITK